MEGWSEAHHSSLPISSRSSGRFRKRNYNRTRINGKYHIILRKKNQLLLSFLKVRAVINGQHIYPLGPDKPVVIPVLENNPRLVITDGYHITKPLKLVYKDLPVYCFNVVCAISDRQLLVAFGVLMAIYLSALYTGFVVLKLLSFMPLIYIVFFYYLNRKEFIRLEPVVS